MQGDFFLKKINGTLEYLGKELLMGFRFICFNLRLPFGSNIPGCGVKLGRLVEGQKLLSEHDPAGP